jgi:predicted DNA-binding protein (UPF0278 family)
MKVSFYRWFKSKFSTKKPKLEDSQIKVVELINSMIRNKNVQMNYSPNSSTRFLHSKNIWVTINKYQIGNESYLIYIINTSSRSSNSHEITIPKEYAYDIIDEFDEELERRMRVVENSRKKVIANELDNLITLIKNDEQGEVR